MSKRVTIGRVALVHKGAFNLETNYSKLDIVSYRGSSYMAIEDSIGVLPTDTSKWQLLAQKGDTPVKGIDYFTEEDINQIEVDVKNDLNFDDTIQEVKEDISKLENDKLNISDVPNIDNLLNYILKEDTGTSISLTIDNNTYVMTLQLKNSDGVVLSQGAVDLPLETMVINADYDDDTQEIVLTLKNGNTTRVSVAGLIKGLQKEITSTNKLSADLVDDTNSANKFVTPAEKNSWNNKAKISDIPTKTSDLTNDSDFANKTYIDEKIGDIDSALDLINGESIE